MTVRGGGDTLTFEANILIWIPRIGIIPGRGSRSVKDSYPEVCRILAQKCEGFLPGM